MHSGESDFDPPRFKPNPSVYLKAAETEGKDPVNCIAVEDSGSGVGSASNAGVGECPIHRTRERQVLESSSSAVVPFSPRFVLYE